MPLHPRPWCPPAPRRKTLASGLLAASLAAACTPSPTEALLPVREVGSPGPSLASQAPDEATLQLASATVAVGQSLATQLPRWLALVQGGQEAIRQHPAPSALSLLQAEEGWSFRFGWHRWLVGEAGQLLGRFELDDRSPVAFDLTLPENYSPDMHPSVPPNLKHFRAEAALPLPPWGDLALRWTAPLPPAGQPLEATGSGSLVGPGALGSMHLQALAFEVGPDGRILQGLLVTQNFSAGANRQVVAELQADGVVPGAKVQLQGSEAGKLEKQARGWTLVGPTQQVPLP